VLEALDGLLPQSAADNAAGSAGSIDASTLADYDAVGSSSAADRDAVVVGSSARSVSDASTLADYQSESSANSEPETAVAVDELTPARRDSATVVWLIAAISLIVAAVLAYLALLGGSPDSALGTAAESDPASVVPGPSASPPTSEASSPSATTPELPRAQDYSPAVLLAYEERPGPVEPEDRPILPLINGSNDALVRNFLPIPWPDFEIRFFHPTPCPYKEPLVACIDWASVDRETRELSVHVFTAGFTSTIEPPGHRIHFYIPEQVDGDESRAGTGPPDGDWLPFDGPYPATSTGGDNGRTIYNWDDLRQAGSTTICVTVADPQGKAIRGSGNCLSLADNAHIDGDVDLANEHAGSIGGQWVGQCSHRAMAIAPTGWQWFDLAVEDPEDIAAQLSIPFDDTERELQAAVDQGAVLWAAGPDVDGIPVHFSLATIEGDFGLTSTPQQVAAELERVGAATPAGHRSVGIRELLYEAVELDDGRAAFTYIVPDFGYAIAYVFTAPIGFTVDVGVPHEITDDGWDADELAKRIAYTIQGC